MIDLIIAIILKTAFLFTIINIFIAINILLIKVIIYNIKDTNKIINEEKQFNDIINKIIKESKIKQDCNWRLGVRWAFKRLKDELIN